MKDLKEKLQEVIDSATDYAKEMDRLREIEKRVKTEFEILEEEVKGLEKALGYSSIPGDARRLLLRNQEECKRKMNRLAFTLGIDTPYRDIK